MIVRLRIDTGEHGCGIYSDDHRITVSFTLYSPEIRCKSKQTHKIVVIVFLCYFKLCASFHSNMLIQTVVTGRKRPIRVKIGDFFVRVTFTFNGGAWLTMGHLLYATFSFAHVFITICKFKLELQSGNTQFGWKSFLCCVTLKFHG